MKKNIGFYIVILVFTVLSMVVVYALTTDVEPPVLASFSLQKNEAVSGEIIPININVSDDISGVAIVRASFITEKLDWDSYNFFEATINGNTLHLPNNIRPGRYILSSISTADNASNSRVYSAITWDPVKIEGLSTGEYIWNKNCADNVNWGNIVLEIKSGGNTQSFTFHNLSINKDNFKPGERAVFTAQITGDVNKIRTLDVRLQILLVVEILFHYIMIDNPISLLVNT